jgi:hypothetical protein
VAAPGAVSAPEAPPGLSDWQARLVERTIIGLSVLALVLVFQPFSLRLFGAGTILVVVAGLAFNLVPLCRPGVPARRLGLVALLVLGILVVVGGLAIGSAHLYGVWMQRS